MTDTLFIAASDSTEKDKESADLICTGVNDQDVIQEALDTVFSPVCGEIRGRRIMLLPGNYYITAFPRKNENGRVNFTQNTIYTTSAAALDGRLTEFISQCARLGVRVPGRI